MPLRGRRRRLPGGFYSSACGQWRIGLGGSHRNGAAKLRLFKTANRLDQTRVLRPRTVHPFGKVLHDRARDLGFRKQLLPFRRCARGKRLFHPDRELDTQISPHALRQGYVSVGNRLACWIIRRRVDDPEPLHERCQSKILGVSRLC